jgi:hypothetical protein
MYQKIQQTETNMLNQRTVTAVTESNEWDPDDETNLRNQSD